MTRAERTKAGFGFTSVTAGIPTSSTTTRRPGRVAGRCQVLPKSALATAIGYTRRQWAALERYLDDGELGPDNSASERALRGVALGRKNWLFAGSDAGGIRAAKLYSLIASAKRHALEPYAYLRVLFERLPSHPADRLHELAPALWAADLASR